MIRELTTKEMEQVYHTHMVKDFPASEMKKWEHLNEMIDRNIYFAYGYFQDDKLLAYAFFLGPENKEYLLLDYYAVTADVRSSGIGSKFLAQWKDALADVRVVIGEVEDPDFARNDAEKMMQERRIRFYERNGLQATGIKSSVMGVKYKVIYLPILEEQPDESLYQELEAVYHLMYPENYPADKIIMSL